MANKCCKSGASYNRMITLQSPSGTRDAVGERSTTWADVVATWAAINPLSVRDLIAAGQTQSEITHRVKIRYESTVASIAPSWRVKYGERILVIMGVRNLEEANRELELLCSEGLRQE